MPTTSVLFNINENDANYGKIVIDIDASDLVISDPANAEIRVGIEGPAGTVKAFPVAADISGIMIGQVIDDVPVDVNGDFLTGDYSVRVEVIDTDGPTVLYDETETWCFSAPTDNSIVIDTQIVTDCYSKNIIITDATVYPDGADVTRTTTIDHPTIPGVTDVPNTVSTDEEIVVPITHENVVYQVSVVVALTTEEVEGDFTFQREYTDATNVVQWDILCNLDACGIIDCVNDEVERLLSNACAVGGISNLKKEDADKLSLIMSYLAMFNYYVSCNDTDTANEYYAKLKALVGECPCAESDQPRPIGDTGIIYLQGDSAYDVWVSQGNVGTEEDFINSLYPVGEWVEVDAAHFESNYESSTTNPLQYRILKTHIEFKGDYRKKIAGIPTGLNPFVLLEDTFDPGTIDPLGLALNSIDGASTGTFFRGFDDKWYINWDTTSYNSTPYNRISGQIPLEGVATSNIGGVQPIDWTPFPASAYLNGYTPTFTDELSYKISNGHMYFKGSFDAVAFATTGFDVIAASYFEDLGITLNENYSLSMIDKGTGATTNIFIGRMTVVGGALKAFANASADVSHGTTLTGLLPYD